MFVLSSTPLDPAALRAATSRPDAGALVVFEGHVRTHNEGREVARLEYEGAKDLARNEFARIEAEARQQFGVLEVHCVHRVGTLDIGETAVWVGVAGTHRDEAFQACRYVIDELKKRLPLWKREHYADGAADWLNAP